MIKKIKDSEEIADVFNSFYLSLAENLNLYQVGKEDPISFFPKINFLANSMVLKLFQPLRLRSIV
jgi:hypothetical protein